MDNDSWIDRMLDACTDALWCDPLPDPFDLVAQQEEQQIKDIGENFAGHKV